MKELIVEFEDLSDSKEMYGHRPNPFIAVFIYVIMIILVVATVFVCFAKIDIVSTASGVIQSNDSISVLSSPVIEKNGTVTPDNNSKHIASLYIKNSDIAKIHLGDEVKISILALPTAQYGFARGTISKLSSNTIVQGDSNTGFYLAECIMDNADLPDKRGNKGIILAGMQIEAKIVTESETIMQYIVEKITL